MEKYNLSIPVFGMIKDNKHKTKGLINEKKEEINLTEELKNIVTNLQDEVHRAAIEYHKKLRNKEMTKSELDNIKGIGEKKKQNLLKKYGTVEKVKENLKKKS